MERRRVVANCTRPGPITVLPLGTENLLSKHLGLSADPEQVCQTILDGASVRLDAGQANGRLFLLMVGCGFDAEVVRRLHARRKGHIRHVSYVKPIFDSIRSYGYPELRVYCGGPGEPPVQPVGRGGRRRTSATAPIRSRWVFVANLPCYGGGLRIVPNASAADGLLDLCAFEHGSFWNGLRYLGGVVSGRHQSWDDCLSLRTGRLRIESDEPAPYQLDGDPGGVLPVEISVLPERLTVLAPRKWALRQGFQPPEPPA